MPQIIFEGYFSLDPLEIGDEVEVVVTIRKSGAKFVDNGLITSKWGNDVFVGAPFLFGLEIETSHYGRTKLERTD